MKYLTILGLIGICALGSSLALVPPHNNPVVVPTPPPAPTLAQDLDEIIRMVPFVPIRRLITRYLLNDEQFQAFVRIINSNDAYVTQMRFRSQPEVMAFLTWDMIRAHIQMKIAQNGIFAQFDQKLKTLKSAYERVIALPEAQRVVAALKAKGINPADLDTFIRNLCGWQNPPTIAPPVSSNTPAVPVAPVA
ncbi:hypothetical protein DOY81_006669 [Sarcophaga bullata]|nr:hypothetical protein DOY81_006669 [Sarcophaga bullata]